MRLPHAICLYLIVASVAPSHRRKNGQNVQPIILNELKQVYDFCSHTNLHFRNITEEVLIPGIFKQCSLVTVLSLANNEISHILPGTFDDLVSLTELYLSHNKISELVPNSFINLVNLRIIEINWNRLIVLPDFEMSSSRFTHVLFNHNMIKLLEPISLNCIVDIDELDLSSNELRDFSISALINLRSCGIINLSHNYLSSLPVILKEGYSRFMPTSHLVLNNNLFVSINNMTLGEFYKLNLQSIDFSFNNVTKITANAFDRYGRLKSLRLRRNKLTYLHERIFSKLTVLEELDLSFNMLTNLIFTIDLPQYLRNFNLNHNLLGPSLDFNWLIYTNKRIDFLHMDHNKLGFLDANFYGASIGMVSINWNNWKCDVLYGIIRNLERRNIGIERGCDIEHDNINGILCELN